MPLQLACLIVEPGKLRAPDDEREMSEYRIGLLAPRA
jgi:hypothetical protein